MNKLTQISITATAETAVKKLKKAEICIYNCRKDGVRFIFSVKSKDVKKVFAIFIKPCYNIRAERLGAKERFKKLISLRAGLAVGAAAFLALAWLSSSFIFKIEISGSGSFMQSEVLRIIYSEGAREFTPCLSFNKSVAAGRILALPHVTFCHIEKRGSVLVVDVQVNDEHNGGVTSQPLVSDVDGTIKNIVAICGTSAVSAGDSVKKGDTLIYASVKSGEEYIPSIAVGYAEIECSGKSQFFATEESDENLKNAYYSLLIEGEEITSFHAVVKPTEGGVIYDIDFTYLHKLRINSN